MDLIEHLPKLQAFAYKLTRDKERMQDLVNDTVVLALRNEKTFIPGTNLAAWLFTIMRNYYYTEKRRSWRQVELAEGEAEKIPQAANALVVIELKQTLEAMKVLPVEWSRALMLIADGLEYEEIAVIENVAVGTVKSRVARARRELRSLMGV